MSNIEENYQQGTLTLSVNTVALSESERNQIVEILERRASDISSFKHEATRTYDRLGSGMTNKDVRVTAELPGSVDLALDREIHRLRRLADKVRVPKPVEEGEE